MRNLTSAWLLVLGCLACSDSAGRVSGLDPGTKTPDPVPLGPDPTLTGRIVFVSDRDGVAHIYVANANGTGIIPLTSSPAADRSPAWSPDGKQIAFARAGANNTRSIHVMNADGSGVTNLTSGAFADSDPAWSPDGRRIAFARATGDSESSIYVMNADGSGITNLLIPMLRDEAPSWSPDGTMIAFNRTVDFFGDWFTQVYVVNADGSNERRMTKPDGGRQYAEGYPAWSPDGRSIAFWSWGFGVAIIENNPGGYTYSVHAATNVAPGSNGMAARFDSHPSWSPEGNKLVFVLHSTTTSNSTRLYTVDVRTFVVRPLFATVLASNDYAPAWAPAK